MQGDVILNFWRIEEVELNIVENDGSCTGIGIDFARYLWRYCFPGNC